MDNLFKLENHARARVGRDATTVAGPEPDIRCTRNPVGIGLTGTRTIQVTENQITENFIY